MGIITDTYSDEDIVKTFLVLELYDESALTANITAQAKNAKKWANTYIGKQADFTVAELAEIKNEGIILATSRYTAYLLELKRQERAERISEDTKMDKEGAEKLLDIWMQNNGVIPRRGNVSVKIPFAYSEEEYVI